MGSEIAGVEGVEGCEGAERSEETETWMVAPHSWQRADTEISSTFMSESNENELFEPHLQATYFLRDTIGITTRGNGEEVNNMWWAKKA